MCGIISIPIKGMIEVKAICFSDKVQHRFHYNNGAQALNDISHPAVQG